MKKNIFIMALVLCLALFIFFFPKTKSLERYTYNHQMLTVKIDGAVNTPGSYQINTGKTLGYLIHLAGGLSSHANLTDLDLGMMVDSTNYHIPFYEEIEYDVIIKLNLNEADYESLLKIPYLNEAKVLDILMYRRNHQKFTHLNELLEIKGIGEKTLEKLKVYLRV